jgi:hypothetical protein
MARWISIGAVVIIVAALAVYFLLPASSVNAPTGGTPAGQNPSRGDLIFVTSLRANEKVSSPIFLKGEARGYWYFEASFPYQLKNEAGEVLAEGPVQAEGEWMTTDYVPFSLTINFPAQASGSKGTLTLMKDNPSGLPENDDALVIPVTF